MGKADKDSERRVRGRVSFKNLRLLVLVNFGVIVFGYAMISCSTEAHREFFVKPAAGPTPAPLVSIDPNLDFAVFKHENSQHERLPCSYCHVRSDNSAVPKWSGHQQCAGCHVEQFDDKKSSLCAVCHSDTESGALKRFSGLHNFGARFEHARHVRQTDCATCHKPAANGTAFTIPNRSNSHATCFQCHTPDKSVAGKNIGTCNTCHQTGRPPFAVTETAVAFSKGFEHRDHNMNCSACHTVRAGGARGTQVGSIAIKMHLPPKGKSCASCHNNKAAFGGDDFKDCRRCHTGSRFDFP